MREEISGLKKSTSALEGQLQAKVTAFEAQEAAVDAANQSSAQHQHEAMILKEKLQSLTAGLKRAADEQSLLHREHEQSRRQASDQVCN